MTDTVQVAVIDSDWTEVQQGSAGVITNNSYRDVAVREAATKPDASITVGHIIHPQGAITYGLETGQKVWARSKVPNIEVSVTRAL